jgi:2-aminoadipate transaminase
MPFFARRMERLKPSAIREILKVADRPDVLSFAGGLPAPEAFPVAAIARAHAEVLARDGGSALQYATTEGHRPLREWVAARLATKGMRVRADEVLITAGSQQGIDLMARAFLDPGDIVVVESPSYLAALQSFTALEAQFLVVGSDDEGMRVDELADVLRATRPKLIYIVPTFQNPRGTTLSLSRRQKLARLAAEHGVPLLEDDPYGELRYSGAELPPLAALEPDAPITYLGTFSKTLAPGMRLGWAVGRPEIIGALTVAKQAADLHTSTLSQRAVSCLLETFDYEAHLIAVRALYRERRDSMLAALAREMPDGTRWTMPDGGLFLWVQLPDGRDAEELFQHAIAEKVAFVPGASFYARHPRRETLRLNFSNRPRELIEVGVARLGATLHKLR